MRGRSLVLLCELPREAYPLLNEEGGRIDGEGLIKGTWRGEIEAEEVGKTMVSM